MSEFSEKRQMSRADYQIPCQLEYDETIYLGEIINFSLTGFLVSINDITPFSIGNKISLIINNFISVDTHSEIECEIVRANYSILGLKFAALDYDTLMKFNDILSTIIQDKNQTIKEYIKSLENQ